MCVTCFGGQPVFTPSGNSLSSSSLAPVYCFGGQPVFISVSVSLCHGELHLLFFSVWVPARSDPVVTEVLFLGWAWPGDWIREGGFPLERMS